MKNFASLAFPELTTLCLKSEERPLMLLCAQILKDAGYKTLRHPDYHYLICHPPTSCAIALIAHCDTVGKTPPKTVNNRNGILTNPDGILGADDRAGVAAILEVVRGGSRPVIYLTTGEEIGCIGAKELVKHTAYTPPECVHALIQIDRQGGHDFVTYACDSPALDSWTTGHGFVKATGSCSDISQLAPAWKIAAANVSAGYYGQHGANETLVLPQLYHTVERLRSMIQNPPAARLPYIARVYATTNYGSSYTAGWMDDYAGGHNGMYHWNREKSCMVDKSGKPKLWAYEDPNNAAYLIDPDYYFDQNKTQSSPNGRWLRIGNLTSERIVRKAKKRAAKALRWRHPSPTDKGPGLRIPFAASHLPVSPDGEEEDTDDAIVLTAAPTAAELTRIETAAALDHAADQGPHDETCLKCGKKFHWHSDNFDPTLSMCLACFAAIQTQDA